MSRPGPQGRSQQQADAEAKAKADADAAAQQAEVELQEAEDAELDGPATAKAESGDYRVLTGAITVSTGNPKDKRESVRHVRGAKVKLDSGVHEIARLLSLRAIEPWNDEKSIGRTTARHLVFAANATAQESQPADLPEAHPMSQERADNSADYTPLDDGGKTDQS